jgi:hypothetical protein
VFPCFREPFSSREAGDASEAILKISLASPATTITISSALILLPFDTIAGAPALNATAIHVDAT